jgi:deoxyadenosine/deoxycytidine kinase
MANSVVLVAGNIGAGKTEICRIIAKNKNVFLPLMNDWGTSKEVITVPEFIDPEALELFYSDRKRYTGIFEDSCLIHRIVRHLEARDKGGLFIFDRGMIEGAETFCKNSFEEGYLSHSRYERYLGGLKDALDDL